MPPSRLSLFSRLIAIQVKSYRAPEIRRERSARFHCFTLCILLFVLTAPSVSAEVVQGQGVSRFGEHIHLGPIDIPWSKANAHFGYVYKRPGLSFANVSPGPWIWQPTPYLSYDGFSSVDTIGSPSTMRFSIPESVVFAASPSPLYQSFNRGILLVRYYHTYGAIYFSKIAGNTIHYQYWYNPSGQCTFNTKNAGSEERPAIREFSEDQMWDDLTITEGETFIFDQSLKINGTLEITEGTVILKGKYAEFKNITIEKNGRLLAPSGTVIVISGNLKNNGELSTNEGTLVFNGNTPQSISGAIQVQTLEIDTTSFVIAHSPLTVQELYLFKGALAPSTGSVFHHIFIDEEGIFYPFYFAEITITGHLYNGGQFFHNGGSVTLSGDTLQYIIMNGEAFYNLNILVPELLIDEILVKGNLFMEPGVKVTNDAYPLL